MPHDRDTSIFDVLPLPSRPVQGLPPYLPLPETPTYGGGFEYPQGGLSGGGGGGGSGGALDKIGKALSSDAGKRAAEVGLGALAELFKGSPFQARRSFEGTELDPVGFGTQLKHALGNLGEVALSRAKRPVQIRTPDFAKFEANIPGIPFSFKTPNVDPSQFNFSAGGLPADAGEAVAALLMLLRGMAGRGGSNLTGRSNFDTNPPRQPGDPTFPTDRGAYRRGPLLL